MSLRVGAVVQARMSSERLPGKVLTPLAGRPMLGWLLERLEHARTLDVVVVRVNGDSPLLDQRLIDRGVELLKQTGAELVSNVRPRTFPPGQSVEVVRTEALERAHARDSSDEDREHVTGPLYSGDFTVVRFEADPPRTTPAFTVDTPDDLARIEKILSDMDRPAFDYTWEDLL